MPRCELLQADGGPECLQMPPRQPPGRKLGLFPKPRPPLVTSHGLEQGSHLPEKNRHTHSSQPNTTSLPSPDGPCRAQLVLAAGFGF